uniref:Interferon regulatory factor 2 binding protein 1 n=1 Tax=Tetraodon nigroviridis TaxID=99883 RepID=H3C644_TETNG
ARASMSSGRQAASRRQWCYLCDLPKTPWALLWDFSEAVCRGCVNYDGADRVELLIDAARQLKFSHGVLEERRYEPRTPSRPEEERASPGARGSVAQAPMGQGPGQGQGQGPLAGPHELLALSRCGPEAGRRQAPPAAASTSAAAELNEAVCNRVEGWPRQPRPVQDVLAVLSSCVPFAVRFRKEHALVGRVLAFEAGAAPQPELRVFVEYPAASGLVFCSVPDLVRQMFRDLAKVRHLEYEPQAGAWRPLADLLSEAVRAFKEPPGPDVLPQADALAGAGHPPKGAARRRREKGEGVAPAWLRLEALPGPPEGTPPVSVLMGGADGDTPAPSSSYPPARQPVGSGHLCCTLCQEHLEDTHFVQCPSVPLHKFCFPCTRAFIRGQDPGAEVYCPSGRRCPLSAAAAPWAFMQGEIATILGGEGVSVKKESEP